MGSLLEPSLGQEHPDARSAALRLPGAFCLQVSFELRSPHGRSRLGARHRTCHPAPGFRVFFFGDLGGQLFCDFSCEVCPAFQQRDFLGNKMQDIIPCPDVHFPPHIWYNHQAAAAIITVMSLKSNLFN